MKAPRLCAFCGKPGTMTKQHIWPKWLKKIVPQVASSHTQVSGEFLTFKPGAKTPPRKEAIFQGPAGSRKIKNVCERCNNGWMSQIEQAAMGSAIPMINNLACTISPQEQRVLASWFALMTMMIEFTGPDSINDGGTQIALSALSRAAPNF
jgi:hypothetical protein